MVSRMLTVDAPEESMMTSAFSLLRNLRNFMLITFFSTMV